MLSNLFGFRDLYAYVWLIPLLFGIHEFEEWNILEWYKKYYRNLPESTNTSIHIHIIVFCAVSILLTLAAYAARETFLFSLIVVFLSTFMLLNFLQHIIWTVQLKAYSPGLATAILSMIAIAAVNVLYIRYHLIILPFYCILLLVIPSVIRTMRVKGEMTKDLLAVHHFFIKLEKALRGKGG